MWKKAAVLFTIVSLCVGLWSSVAGAVTTSAMRVLLYLDQSAAYVNETVTMLDSPAVAVEGKTYVPVKFLGDSFGFPVSFDAVTSTISVTAGNTDVLVDLNTRTALIGGVSSPMEPTFRIINDRLMAQLTWMMDRIGARYTYDHDLRRVEVLYLPEPKGIDAGGNSRPVAKFTFGKSSYKLGEPVKYINLSYDVDGDGIAFVSWRNNQPAFFEPGKHKVSLQVTDSKNNTSEWFTKEITIENERVMSPVDFQMHYAKEQELVKLTRTDITQHFSKAAKLPFSVREGTGRKLLVSDSPENIKEPGVLYRDTVNGSGRLYAHHINSTEHPLQFAIVATNHSKNPVTIRTTKQGEVYPSIYANLIGHQATVDFLIGDVSKGTVVVGPGQSEAYAMLPRFMPGQGLNLMYDVETDGPVTFSFAAMTPGDPMDAVNWYKELPYDNHVRGSFEVSDLHWDVNAGGISGLKSITIGDNISDVFVKGYDVFRKEFVSNYGNYGVKYNIRVHQPGKTAIVLLARGGAFKGPFKIDGEMMLAPSSGTITAYDGVFLLGRTEGNEPYVDIEFSPPAGSAFPIDLIFYPLK